MVWARPERNSERTRLGDDWRIGVTSDSEIRDPSVVREELQDLFAYLSMSSHYESISRGVIDTKDLIYFLSIIFLGLIATEAVLSKRTIAEF